MTPLFSCPTCKSSLDQGIDECPTCGQLFCPACSYVIDESTTSCPNCFTEFAFFCPGCDGEVNAKTSVCEHCGMVLESESVTLPTSSNLAPIVISGAVADSDTGFCPVCHSAVYAEDGFCNECGQTFCAVCGHPTNDVDERCPGCGVWLFFDCPSCGFELASGTGICPNCGALFPQFCPSCAAAVNHGDTRCASCNTILSVHQRTSARTVQSFVIGQRLVQLVACPSCGKNFDPMTVENPGSCSKCGLRLCIQCHIILDDGEQYCPRCGLVEITPTIMNFQAHCPACHYPISSDQTECDHCHQQLCPACRTAVSEDDVRCPECNAEFELYCPACNNQVTIEDRRCPDCGLAF